MQSEPFPPGNVLHLAPGRSSGCLSESENIYRAFFFPLNIAVTKMPGTHRKLQAAPFCIFLKNV